MKKSSRNINRNTEVFNHIRNNSPRNNLLPPDYMVNQLWLQDEDTNGVKIIELNSSSSEDTAVNNTNHVWNYTNNDSAEDVGDIYRINEEARHRYRMRNNEHNFTPAYTNPYFFNRDKQTNSNGNSTYYCSPQINRNPVNRPINCFTLLNNQNVNSDSSTDDDNFESIEIIELDNTDDNKYWDHVYNEKVVTYDPKANSEKHTIFIYSYKNNRLLSENSYDLVNVPSKFSSGTSTSCSISDEEEKDIGTNTFRTGSPIPATFIPRLDLSLMQTLSTVTEISETNKPSNGSSYEKVNFKPKNNWLTDRTEVTNQKGANVINWMALSPRERRRRSINTNLDIKEKKHVNVADRTFAEGLTQSNPVSAKAKKVVSSVMQVQADVHVNEYGMEEVRNLANVVPIKIPIVEDDIDRESEEHEIDYKSKPRILISNKINKTQITEPMDKLTSSNWIIEEKQEEEKSIYNYDLENNVEVSDKLSDSENIDGESPSKNLWRRNLQLMKPPQWNEYLPITCSPPSLHIAISLPSINGTKSWLKRLARCIKCCK